LEILSLCQEFSNDGVVGIDLAGDETLGEIPAMKGHVNAFKVGLLFFSFFRNSAFLRRTKVIRQC